MVTRWLLAAIHLLALGIGMGAVWARGQALRGELDLAGLRRVLVADSRWGIAALLWVSSGLVRAFGGFEKGSSYYLQNHVFWGKMALFGLIVLLELAPMMSFIRWRMQLAKGERPDTSLAPRYATISTIQTWLLVPMVLVATALARGYGAQ